MKNILIIEDEESFVEALSIRLGYFGWSVHRAGSPEEGIEAAARLKPDLIIMDINFQGGMDGYEASRKLKSDRFLKDIPLILLTVRAMREDIEEGFRAGADCYFTKPLDGGKFLDRVKAYLGENDGS